MGLSDLTSVKIFYAISVAAAINAAVHGSHHILAIFLGWLTADIFTGLYHFLLDNFKWKNVPILEDQAKAFQDHHNFPRAIVADSTSEIIKPASYSGILVLLLSMFFSGFISVFLASFAFIAAISQAIHRWSHCKRSERPIIINILIKLRIILNDRHHMVHHRAPYQINYAIVSGLTDLIFNKVYPKIISWIRR